jgi:abhydrolase domain-containing protein 6
MSVVQTNTAAVLGHPCRFFQKGAGPALFWFPASQTSLKWSPFHEALASRARLSACCLPGFGGSEGQDAIDDHLTWCLAARDLLLAAGFKAGDTLIGSSATGAIAADVAALWPELVGRLILIAPFGLYDMHRPSRDMFAVLAKEAPAVFCENPQAYVDQVQTPADEEEIVWSIKVNRAQEAAARILWPFGDTRLAQRLHRVIAPTLLLWGAADKVVPPAYAERFAGAITGKTSTRIVAGAGHIVELDRPREAADAVFSFMN